MTGDMKTVINRLEGLPEEVQSTLAPHLNDYLNQLDDLRNAIQEGLNSGKPQTYTKSELLEHIHHIHEDQVREQR